jgi:hypothetical protein
MNRVSSMRYAPILERRQSVAKPAIRLSRRGFIILIVVLCLGALAGLLAFKALPVARLYQKASQSVPQMFEELYNQAYFGLNPGTPVINEATLPAVSLDQPAVSAVTGPLKQSTVNKRYFADPSGKIVYLTGSHTWSNLQDNGGSNPPPAFNYTAYLNFLETNNHNFFRLWTWEQARWTVETNDNNYWFSPMPYQRSGPGTALDGQPKYDLTKFNQAYFNRMRSRIIAARDRGIYVSIMLFDGWSLEPVKGGSTSGKNPWLGHPFNKSNNINSVNGDPNNDNNGKEVHTTAVAAVTNYQKAYIAKIIDTVHDLDNVLYEISNESDPGSTTWQYAMINYIHQYEASKSYDLHPVGMTYQYPGGSNANLDASPADWISPLIDMQNPPAVSASTTKVLIPDTDHICGICGDGVLEFTWKSLTRGYNPIYMDVYDGAGYGVGANGFNPNDPKYVLARKNLGYARAYAERINLATATPRAVGFCSTGFCLANTSGGSPKYLVYAPNGGNFTVDLTANAIDFMMEWFNPATGKKQFAGKVTGGTSRQFSTPNTISGSSVLFLYPYVDINANHNYLPEVPHILPGQMIPLSPAPQGNQ